jgi:hypothetical protein
MKSYAIKTISGDVYLWKPDFDPNFKGAHTSRPNEYMRSYAIYAKSMNNNEYMNIFPNSIEGYMELKNDKDIEKYLK